MTRVGLLLALVLAGCDLLDAGPTVTEISGVVIDASLDRPLVGLGVSLRTGGWTGGSAAATDRTDANGRFSLRAEGYDFLQFEVNDEPYDPRYHYEINSYVQGERGERTVRVYQTARLTVLAETDRPLQDGEWYTISMSCTTGTAPLTSDCLRGNDWNDVTLRVKRGGAAYRDTVIPVYVRAGEDNVVTVAY